MMRIVFLIVMGIERPSGIRYFNIARELARQGHHVRILALHPNLATCQQRRFILDDVEVWYVGQMHALKNGTTHERFGPVRLLRVIVSSVLGMIWGIICSPADVYHLGKPQPINGLAALVGICLLRRQRFYVDCDDDETQSNRFSAAWQRHIFGFWQWLLPKIAIGVTVNTVFLQQRLRNQGMRTIAYVPNGVDLTRFARPQPWVTAMLKDALRLTDRRVVAYAGTIALHGHPVDLLLFAFAKLAPALPDVDLLFIGGGEDLPRLRHLAMQLKLQNRVHFVGHVPHDCVPAYLSLAQVSVDPVYADDVARARSPLKVVESMAVGVPVVTGDVGDRVRMLAEASGWTTQAGNPAALAQTLRDVLADPAALAAASQAALAQVPQYSWTELSYRWLRLYDEGHCVVDKAL